MKQLFFLSSMKRNSQHQYRLDHCFNNFWCLQ